MDSPAARRALMALIGAAAGIGLYGLSELYADYPGDTRPVIAFSVLVLVFFTSLLALIGPLRPARAATRAAALAVVVAALYAMTLWRYDGSFTFGRPTTGALEQPLHHLALFLLASLPLPFLIAADGPGWRHYPTLFRQSWSITVRFATGLIFVGLVWLLIWLSDTLLGIAGIEVIGDLLKLDPVPYLISGAALGMGLAVVTELSDMLSADLLLRLMRMLLPVAVVVMAVFLIALPFQGFDGVFRRFSAAGTLLSMGIVGVTLVAATAGPAEGEASSSRLLRGAAWVMCLLLVPLAGLGMAAVWMRIQQYGLTPDRIFALQAAGFALAYGLMHAIAALRGAGWMARVRRGNVWLAVAIVAAAGLWLTPILNAERLSARSQIDRYTDGRTTLADLDLRALQGWGHAGDAAMAQLAALAATPDHADLALRLAEAGDSPPDPEALLAALVAILPLQPPTATGARDTLLSTLPTDALTQWRQACERRLDSGAPGCVMVVADLLPRQPGEEAIVLLNRGTWVEPAGLAMSETGLLRPQIMGDRRLETALIAEWQAAPPPAAPVPAYQLGFENGMFLMPPTGCAEGFAVC